MRDVARIARQRKHNRDLNPLRRREIVRHAVYVGAADSDDFSRWLIAWVWHNPKANDQIWSLMETAKRMGGKLTEAEASTITEEASITRKHRSADNLAKFLGLTYQQRTALRITTIGARDFSKWQRLNQRLHKKRMAKERKRRAAGMRPQSESLSATRPWEVLNMSRRTWERHRNKARDANGATLDPAQLESRGDKVASPEGKKGLPSGAVAPKEERGLPSSRTAVTPAAARFETLPLELRLSALGLELPMGEKLARAA